MAGLFDQVEQKNRQRVLPLAARMRPQSLEQFAGQKHFLGEGCLLPRLLATETLGSLIFYGPPGTGKTTLARLISKQTKANWIALNAASCGVKEVRSGLQQAEKLLSTSGQRTILFVDELHHFTKTQQDVLLPELEQGTVIFIGATTDNPSFALVSPLLSRSHLFEFQPLDSEEILSLVHRALSDTQNGLGRLEVQADDDALEFLAKTADGDARRALNALEIATVSLKNRPADQRRLSIQVLEESLQRKVIRYDNQGDEHYDAASALIKSIRGSDPDAAVYWLARMLDAGEPPRFIARRLMISASEDIGNADPRALTLATSAAQATEMIGMPECRIILSQTTTYLACAPKSNASYRAIDEAIHDLHHDQLIPVPKHLKDRHYAGAKRMGHGEGYQYPHDTEQGWLEQDYLGVDKKYYHPVNRGYEAQMAQYLRNLQNKKEA